MIKPKIWQITFLQFVECVEIGYLQEDLDRFANHCNQNGLFSDLREML